MILIAISTKVMVRVANSAKLGQKDMAWVSHRLHYTLLMTLTISRTCSRSKSQLKQAKDAAVEVVRNKIETNTRGIKLETLKSCISSMKLPRKTARSL
jgi:hypothetical protein